MYVGRDDMYAWGAVCGYKPRTQDPSVSLSPNTILGCWHNVRQKTL